MRNEWTPERILQLRHQLRMTQQEFATAVGVTSGVSVSRWERGRCSPDRRSQMALNRLDARASESML